MPTYEYRCVACEKDYIIEARMSDPAPEKGSECHGDECRLEKKISRVSGWVKGKAASPREAPVRAAATKESNDPVHLCSKYCDHHAKA